MIDINKLIMSSMKAHDNIRTETYRAIKTKFIEYKTAKNAKPFDESAEVQILLKMVKERKDDIEIFRTAGRKTLEDQTAKEVSIIEELLPRIPTKIDVEVFVKKNYPNGIDKKQMGNVIKNVKANLVGVDGKTVAEVVKNHLV